MKKDEVETPKKKRRETSKFHRYINYGLKQKLRCWVLTPLISGIIITVAISFVIILWVEPSWFAMTGTEIVQNQQNSMKSISQSLSDYTRAYMQRIINDVLFINDYTKKVLTRNPYYYSANKPFRAIQNVLAQTLSPTSYPFNLSPVGNLAFFGWFLNNNTFDISQIQNSNTLDNLNISKNIEIVMRPIYLNSFRLLQAENKSSYLAIFHIFEDDGLFYLYPCPTNQTPFNSSLYVMNQSCLQSKNISSNFSLNCEEFYVETKNLAEIYNVTINVKPPYLYNNSQYLSANIYDPDVNLAIRVCGSILNSTTEKLKFQTCIEANVTDLKYYFKDSSAMKLGDLTVLGYNKENFIGDVIFRRDLNVSNYGIDKKSLIQLEFQKDENSTDQEVLDFIDMFNQSYNMTNGVPFVGIYKKNGDNYLLSITHIKTYMSFNASDDPMNLLSIMFTIGETALLANFTDVKSQVQSKLITQLLIIGAVIIVILIISLLTINYIANSIVSPMDDLVMKVRKLQDGDDEVEIIDNFTEKSYEINCLYLTFSKLANVLKYANKAFFEGNDAEALIRYAQALKLFSDLNNRKAMASIYNNIGNIHLIGERYEEAIENYKQSVEITEDELKKLSKIEKSKNVHKDIVGTSINKIGASKKTLKLLEKDSIKSGGNSGYSNLKYSLKTDAKNSKTSGSIRDSKTSKRSTVGPQSGSELKAIFESQIANRQYQLVNALLIQAEKKKVNNWDEITKRLNKVLRTDIEHKRNTSRIVKTHLMISNAFLEMGDYKKSAQHINSAEEKLREYTNMFLQGFISEREIPPEILQQKVYLQKGMLLKKIGRTRSAAEKFTNCLELGTIYDPEIRRKCLEELKEIFDSNGLLNEIPNIPKILENTVSKKNKDIVFALDYSESMTQPGRLKHATKAIVTIYDDYIKDNDRVGFIRFNKNVDVIFGLSERGKNRVYLRKCLQNVEEVIKPHGETAFFTAIKEALKLHKKAERRDHSRWIVALTDGEDNSSRIKYEEIYKKLNNSDINLIIVGLALDEKIIPLLRELCLATPEGVFIETPVSKDLDIAFQSITDIIYGTSDIIIESWS